MPNLYKSALRNSYKAIRTLLPQNYQDYASQSICEKIKQMPIYHSSKKIGMYRAFGGEVNIHELWIDACQTQKTSYFPVITKNQQMIFCNPDGEIAAEALDLVLVPLLAFDMNGHRLGFGGGYYDRTFGQKTKPLRIGIAYTFQQEAVLLAEPHDSPLQAIVTETAIYTPFKNKIHQLYWSKFIDHSDDTHV